MVNRTRLTGKTIIEAMKIIVKINIKRGNRRNALCNMHTCDSQLCKNMLNRIVLRTTEVMKRISFHEVDRIKYI